jgi:hypothetical protein
MHDEAAETEERCTTLAGEFDGKKTAILDSARETKQEASEMMKTYLGDQDHPLDGLEFLTMAEAGEVGHWSIVGKLNERAGDARVGELVDWALPIQQRHFQDVLHGSNGVAAAAAAGLLMTMTGTIGGFASPPGPATTGSFAEAAGPVTRRVGMAQKRWGER